MFTQQYDRKNRIYRIEETDLYGTKYVTYCKTKEEVKEEKKRYKQKISLQKSTLKSTVDFLDNYSESTIPIDTPPQKSISLTEQFYNELPEDWYYAIEEFWLRLYDSEGNRRKLCLNDEMVDEIQLAKFSLINSKYKKYVEQKLEEAGFYFKFKRVVSRYYFLVVLANCNFTKKRCGFELPNYGQQMTYAMMKRDWKTLDKYSFENFTITVGEAK